MLAEKVYSKPIVLSHQQIRFETAQSWNPGCGNLDHPGKGNDGVKFPKGNPNPQPGGAGASGQGNGSGNGNGGNVGGIGQCNP